LSKPCRTEKSSGADSLHEYIEAARHKPFAWGSHDCLRFAIGAVTVQTGREYPLPWYATPYGAARMARKVNLLKRLDKAFWRCPHVPPPGSLVAVQEDGPAGYRLGVVISDKAAFVSPSGLIFDRLHPETDLYWVVK